MEKTLKTDIRTIESFLFKEAQLLDEWRLDEWLTLFREDASYLIPSNDRPAGDPKKVLFLVADDYPRLRGRVNRLKSSEAHIENPHSRTRRFISNVQMEDGPGHEIHVIANFIVYRNRKGDEIGVFTGKYEYTLDVNGSDIKIVRKKSILDREELGSLRTLAILL